MAKGHPLSISQVMRVKVVLGESSRQYSPQAGTWVWGSKEGGQVGGEGTRLRGARLPPWPRTCSSSSCSVLAPPQHGLCLLVALSRLRHH